MSLPPNTGSEIQSLTLARAEARRRALRSMALKILAYRSRDAPRLLLLLGPDETWWTERLTTCLEEQSTVEYSRIDQQVTAKAVISGSAVLDALQIDVGPTGGARSSSATVARAASQSMRQRALSQALTQAREQLGERLLDSRSSGRSIRSLIDRDETLRADFDRMLASIEPEGIRYYPDGSCEVTLVFNRDRLDELIP
ncbi:hypothetical protein IIC65_03535 [Candidatus Sumerlaeota bacterium]|nr:hypothetical protein [Candidatus Sumerlaeota bacterium]